MNTHIRDNLLQTAPALVTTNGDIVYATAASAMTRLGIGASNTVLIVSGGIPAWSASLTLGGAGTALTVTNNAQINSVGIGVAPDGGAGTLDALGVIRARSATFVAPSAGASLEISYRSANDAAFITCYNRSTSAYKSLTIDALAMFLSPNSTGNVKIGGTVTRATTEGNNHLDIFDGTAPVGTLAAGISLYSTAGELRVMDSGGTATLLSPHDDAGYWIFDSKDTVTGRRLRIDVERLLRAVNERFGLDFIKEFIDA